MKICAKCMRWIEPPAGRLDPGEHVLIASLCLTCESKTSPTPESAATSVPRGEALTIFKYPLQIDSMQRVKMPEGAEILCAQVQRGVPCVWVKADESRPMVHRLFALHPTGMAMGGSKATQYVGTVQIDHELVFHVYTEPERVK